MIKTHIPPGCDTETKVTQTPPAAEETKKDSKPTRKFTGLREELDEESKEMRINYTDKCINATQAHMEQEKKIRIISEGGDQSPKNYHVSRDEAIKRLGKSLGLSLNTVKRWLVVGTPDAPFLALTYRDRIAELEQEVDDYKKSLSLANSTYRKLLEMKNAYEDNRLTDAVTNVEDLREDYRKRNYDLIQQRNAARDRREREDEVALRDLTAERDRLKTVVGKLEKELETAESGANDLSTAEREELERLRKVHSVPKVLVVTLTTKKAGQALLTIENDDDVIVTHFPEGAVLIVPDDSLAGVGYILSKAGAAYKIL